MSNTIISINTKRRNPLLHLQKHLHNLQDSIRLSQDEDEESSHRAYEAALLSYSLAALGQLRVRVKFRDKKGVVYRA